MNFGEIKGIVVVSIAGAEKLGSVDNLFLDMSNQRVLGLRVSSGGLFSTHKAVMLEDVKSIGPDAITIDMPSKLQNRKQIATLAGAAELEALLKAHVMTESGTDLGKVSDIDADFDSGQITHYVLGGSFFDRLQRQEHVVVASSVRSIGDRIIVVADNAAEG